MEISASKFLVEEMFNILQVKNSTPRRDSSSNDSTHLMCSRWLYSSSPVFCKELLLGLHSSYLPANFIQKQFEIICSVDSGESIICDI